MALSKERFPTFRQAVDDKHLDNVLQLIWQAAEVHPKRLQDTHLYLLNEAIFNSPNLYISVDPEAHSPFQKMVFDSLNTIWNVYHTERFDNASNFVYDYIALLSMVAGLRILESHDERMKRDIGIYESHEARVLRDWLRIVTQRQYLERLDFEALVRYHKRVALRPKWLKPLESSEVLPLPPVGANRADIEGAQAASSIQWQ